MKRIIILVGALVVCILAIYLIAQTNDVRSQITLKEDSHVKQEETNTGDEAATTDHSKTGEDNIIADESTTKDDNIGDNPEIQGTDVSEAAQLGVPETGNDNQNTEVSEDDISEKVEELLSQMTVEEKVAQLFIITPEAITNVDTATVAGEATKNALSKYPVGGFIYFAWNIISKDQISAMISDAQSYSKTPLFIAVDEEGGQVARVAQKLNVTSFPSMATIGENGNLESAYEVGDVIGKYLKELGFNVDFAPDADVITNLKNEVIGDRSFGTDPKLVSGMVTEVIEGLQGNQISATVKHFPGHGGTEGDSHKGYAYSDRTLEECRNSEFLPFVAGIEAGVDFIMVGHISVENVTGDDTPASLSSVVVNDILRGELKYNGIVITDAMNMGAISQNYSSSQAAVSAIKAGVDIILMPSDFMDAYYGVLAAVESNEISMERLDESVKRILNVKVKRIINQ